MRIDKGVEMMLSLSYALFSSDFLRFFTENRSYDGWEDIALRWVVAALVISVVGAGLMLSVKWYMKRAAGVIRRQPWSRGKTIIFTIVGLLPVLAFAIIVWYASRNFENVIGVSGLLTGVLFSWLLYLMFMFVGHLGPWRRDIF